jgi:hypothetical protein
MRAHQAFCAYTVHEDSSDPARRAQSVGKALARWSEMSRLARAITDAANGGHARQISARCTSPSDTSGRHVAMPARCELLLVPDVSRDSSEDFRDLAGP